MRKNKEGRNYLHPRNFGSDFNCPHHHFDECLNAISESCLKSNFQDVIEKLYSLSPGMRNHKLLPEYFKDILYSANGIDWEFRKLEGIFSSREGNKFTNNLQKVHNYSMDDIAYLDLASKSLMKVISDLKVDLMFLSNYPTIERRQSMIQARILINELETKLYDLIKKIEKYKIKPSKECLNIGQRNNFARGKWSSFPNFKGRQQETNNFDFKINHRLNDVPSHNCSLSETYQKGSWGTASHSSNHCCYDDKEHIVIMPNMAVHDLKHKNINYPKRSRYNNSSGFPKFHCNAMKKEETKYQVLTHSEQRISIPHAARNEVFHKNMDSGLDVSSKQLYSHEQSKVLRSLPPTAKRKQFEKYKYTKSRPPVEYNADPEQGKKNFKRNRRKRTRAGKDAAKPFRSNSKDLEKQNQNYFKGPFGIKEHSQSYANFEKAKYIGLRENKSLSRSDGERPVFRKESSSFCSEYHFELQNKRKDSQPQRRIRPITNRHEQRFRSGANRRARSVNQSTTKQGSAKPMKNKRKGHYERKSPSLFSVHSSEPRYTKRRKIGPRKRKTPRRVDRSTSNVIYRPKNEVPLETIDTRKLRVLDDCNSVYSFCCDEYCCCCFPPSPICSPTDCTYPCCIPSDYCNYRHIPYPMCSNTCCAVQSEQCVIEFERPRKKKIVKRYLPRRSRRSPETHWVSEYYTESKESTYSKEESKESMSLKTNSYKVVHFKPRGPSKTKGKYLKFHREKRERIIEYDSTISNESSPVITQSQGTSTENVSTVDTGSSTYEVIKAVKAIGTNTPKLSTTDIGTDAKPIQEKQKVGMVSKGTATPVPSRTNKQTNTVPEKQSKLKDTGTSPRPEPKKLVKSIGTDPLKTVFQSKSTNTIPLKDKSMPKPMTISRGTEPQPVLTEEKQTSYDKVVTREDGTEPIKVEVLDKEQQFNYEPQAVISEPQLTRPMVGHRQVLSSPSRLENLQTLTNQKERNLQTLTNQKERNLQTLTNQKERYLQTLTNQKERNLQVITKQVKSNVQLIRKAQVQNVQSLSRQPVSHSQTKTNVDLKHMQNVRPQVVKQLHTLSKQPIEQSQIISKQRPGQAQMLLKNLDRPIQVLSKQQVKHMQTKIAPNILEQQTLEDQHPETTLIYQQQPRGEPSPPPTNVERMDELKLGQKPMEQQVFYQTTSDMSMHLIFEKIHEEIFRKRCMFCKCVTQCICKCCNDRCVDNEKIIVCETKRSNTIRITNRSDCKINLKEGENVTNDVDIKLNFNIASSRSAICFTNNKEQNVTDKGFESGFYKKIDEENYYSNRDTFSHGHCPC